MRLPLTALLLTAALAHAGPTVAVVTGPDAPKLERRAADELADQLKQFLDADVTVADKLPPTTEHLILIGSPATNPAVATAVDESLPSSAGAPAGRSDSTRSGSWRLGPVRRVRRLTAGAGAPDRVTAR